MLPIHGNCSTRVESVAAWSRLPRFGDTVPTDFPRTQTG
jgi:hypothetical protein